MKTTANIIINDEVLKIFFSMIENNTKMSTFTTLIQHNTGNPSYSNQTEKEIKGIQIGKEVVKMSLFTNDMMLYIENPNFTPKIYIERIHK